jgi:hypothetical protein
MLRHLGRSATLGVLGRAAFVVLVLAGTASALALYAHVAGPVA